MRRSDTLSPPTLSRHLSLHLPLSSPPAGKGTGLTQLHISYDTLITTPPIQYKTTLFTKRFVCPPSRFCRTPRPIGSIHDTLNRSTSVSCTQSRDTSGKLSLSTASEVSVIRRSGRDEAKKNSVRFSPSRLVRNAAASPAKAAAASAVAGSVVCSSWAPVIIGLPT